MNIIFSRKCLDYFYPGHIESPSRIEKAINILQTRGYALKEPKTASEEDLLRVHTKKWVERVKKGGYFDGDTPGSEKIYEYAALSAGGAMLAAEKKCFSILRPPGHHAGKQGAALGASSLGFCYFNNIAIAVKYLDKPTLILDIDGHHGNGTQEIFLSDHKVIFISLHRSPCYPGTGNWSKSNCHNFPLPAKTGDDIYIQTLDTALNQINMKKIEVIGISAGFDASEGDLASLGLTPSCYRRIGEKISSLDKETFGVLEGGYSGENIAYGLDMLIQGLEKDCKN